MEHESCDSLLGNLPGASTNHGLDNYEADLLHDEEFTRSLIVEFMEPLILQEPPRENNSLGRRDEYVELPEYPRNSSSHPSISEPSNPIPSESFKVFKFHQTNYKQPRSRHLSGWRTTVLSCSYTAIGVLTVNVILMIYGITRHGLDAGQGIIYSGNCSQARTISTTIHILINILSTILLSASNYTMQCLHSPTRAQIDEAHREKKWLDIGIPSWRNRQFVSLRNRTLWWGLGLSSLPLHFIYNSAVFLDIAVQEYHASFTNATISQLLQSNQIPGPLTDYQEMSWQECESTYNRLFVFDHGDVIYVTPDVLGGQNGTSTPNSTAQIYSTTFFPLSSTHYISWVKNQNQALPYPQLTLNNTHISPAKNAPPNALNITPTYHHVTSCYSKTTVGHCKLKFNILIIATVIICNITKAGCMLLTVINAKDYPLVTLGDAIASFLEDPDPTTKNMCLISKEDVEKVWSKPPRPMKWKGVIEKGYYSVSPRRWMNVNILFYAALFSLIIGLIAGIQPGMSAFTTGIGFSSSMNSSPTIVSSGISNNSGFWGTFQAIIIVNTPQFLVSLMNVLYNGLFTAMMLLEEWNSFSQHRKVLRVTAPVGEQKSNYYLTIPYRYAIPLVILTGTFHWLISESFFLVSTTAFNGMEIQPGDSIFGIGYSALAIALAVIVCFLLIVILTFKSLQRIKAGIPVAGSCSAVIGAMCHKSEEEEMPHLKKVMWGVVKGRGEIGAWKDDEGHGHCAFSSELVAPPIPGRLYA